MKRCRESRKVLQPRKGNRPFEGWNGSPILRLETPAYRRSSQRSEKISFGNSIPNSISVNSMRVTDSFFT